MYLTFKYVRCGVYLVDSVIDVIKQKTIFPSLWFVLDFERDKIHRFLNLMFIGPCIILIVGLREKNLMSLVLLFHYLMFNLFRMLIHPSSGVCDVFVELFRGLYCSGSMCVGVTLWFGCGGVVSVCRLRH